MLIEDIGLRFGQIEYELGIEEGTTHFVDILNFDSIRAVYEWAKGKVCDIFRLFIYLYIYTLQSLFEVMQHTELQEGIIVRCIQRVDELLKNIRLAAKNLESKEFEEKLERCSKLIRRDIVFAPSLYTTQDMISVYEEEEPQKSTVPQISENQMIELSNSLLNDGLQDENDYDRDDSDNDDELFKYNFSQNFDEIDNETLNEEQFNSNFL